MVEIDYLLRLRIKMQNCPHCSTKMENYANVCPGCKAERESLSVPGKPFSLVKFIKYFAQVFIISILIAVFMDWDWVLIAGFILGIIHGYDKAKAIPDGINYVWNR